MKIIIQIKYRFPKCSHENYNKKYKGWQASNHLKGLKVVIIMDDDYLALLDRAKTSLPETIKTTRDLKFRSQTYCRKERSQLSETSVLS